MQDFGKTENIGLSGCEKIYAFDSLYTTNHLQMLKILLPCVNPPFQKMLILYIKALEFRNALFLVRKQPYLCSGGTFDHKMLDDLLPFLPKEEANHLKQLYQNLEMLKQIEYFKNMSNEFSENGSDSFDFNTISKLFGTAHSTNDKQPETSGEQSAADIPNTIPNLFKFFQAAENTDDSAAEQFEKRFDDLFMKG